MKNIDIKTLFLDIFLCICFVILIIITPPISVKNPCTILSFATILCIMLFCILPHLKVVKLTRDKCIVHWLWMKKEYEWNELEVIKFGSVGEGQNGDGEGIFFSRDAVKNGKKMTPMRIYNSLDIFNTFYILFLTKTQKKQIMQQLSDWKIKIAFDDEFMQKREYKRVLEEKIQIREERKRLYEDRKKRKR